MYQNEQYAHITSQPARRISIKVSLFFLILADYRTQPTPAVTIANNGTAGPTPLAATRLMFEGWPAGAAMGGNFCARSG